MQEYEWHATRSILVFIEKNIVPSPSPACGGGGGESAYHFSSYALIIM